MPAEYAAYKFAMWQASIARNGHQANWETQRRSRKLQQIQAKARELALSGTFVGWRPIAFNLQFEEGFAEAFDWIYSSATREELDRLCADARARAKERGVRFGAQPKLTETMVTKIRQLRRSETVPEIMQTGLSKASVYRALSRT